MRESGEWGYMERRLIGVRGSLYMDRLTIIRTPWFSIKFHRIYRPDGDRDLHDHPWPFLSFMLLGSYIENTVKGPVRCRWWNFKRAKGRHSILTISRCPIWTLVFCGRKRRIWGFWVDGGTRLVEWQEYDDLKGSPL